MAESQQDNGHLFIGELRRSRQGSHNTICHQPGMVAFRSRKAQGIQVSEQQVNATEAATTNIRCIPSALDKGAHVCKPITPPYEEYGWVMGNDKLVPVE